MDKYNLGKVNCQPSGTASPARRWSGALETFPIISPYRERGRRDLGLTCGAATTQSGRPPRRFGSTSRQSPDSGRDEPRTASSRT